MFHPVLKPCSVWTKRASVVMLKIVIWVCVKRRTPKDVDFLAPTPQVADFKSTPQEPFFLRRPGQAIGRGALASEAGSGSPTVNSSQRRGALVSQWEESLASFPESCKATRNPKKHAFTMQKDHLVGGEPLALRPGDFTGEYPQTGPHGHGANIENMASPRSGVCHNCHITS